MKFVEDQLEALDAYFEPKKESEKWIVILGIAGIISYLAYAYLLPYAESVFQVSESKKKTLQKRIIKNENYLKDITVNGDRNYYIKKYDNDIRNKKQKIENIKQDIVFLDNNLNKLSDMLFNKKSWSIFLNSITKTALDENIEIVYLDNQYVDSQGQFGYVLEIGLGCKGTYKDIVKFMNDIEQNRLVTDVYSSYIYQDENNSASIINADINISVWGINH